MQRKELHWLCNLIRDDIAWHKESDPTVVNVTSEYKKAFIKGMEQAITVLKQVEFCEGVFSD